MSHPLSLPPTLVALVLLGLSTGPLRGDDPPIGLTVNELIVYRHSTLVAWYAKFPPVSAKATTVLLNTSVVQVYAQRNGDWSYRGTVRALTPTKVEDADFGKLQAVIESKEYAALYDSINGAARYNATAAASDPAVYYRKRKETLQTIDKLDLSAGDRALFERVIGESLIDHPAG